MLRFLTIQAIMMASILTTASAAQAETTGDPAGPGATVVTEAGRDLFAGSPTPQLVAKQFKFTEGPTADKHGNVFFTDQPNDKIWKYSIDGKLSVFLSPSGRSNGMYFDKKGNLIACADAKNELWSIAPSGQHTVLVSQQPDLHLNGPNDVWVSPKDGGIFFTDPYYERDYWPAPHPQPMGQYVYYLAPGSHQPVMVEKTLQKPNGIVGTPDGQFLYIADIDGNRTYRYRIGAQGALTDRQLFVEQGSDGMTMDERGNIYLTGKGVTIYSPAGKQLAHLDVPVDWTGNICFGGKDHKLLFITASEGVFTVPMRVRGVQ
jgi:gluconolactonase